MYNKPQVEKQLPGLQLVRRNVAVPNPHQQPVPSPQVLIFFATKKESTATTHENFNIDPRYYINDRRYYNIDLRYYNVDPRYYNNDLRYFNIDSKNYKIYLRYLKINSRNYNNDLRYFNIDYRCLIIHPFFISQLCMLIKG